MQNINELRTSKILWLLLWMTFLAVGLRNFEAGLGIDGPIYSTIARNIARTGEYFYLDGQVPDFLPFAEHPHLGFWLQALIFKFLPAADWSARILGHLFYGGFLLVVFFWLRRMISERVAFYCIFLLWIWPTFSQYFSNAYLDPVALFFAISALSAIWFAEKRGCSKRAFVSGLSLGFCFLAKGLLVLGIGLAYVWILLSPCFAQGKAKMNKNLRLAGLSLIGASIIVATYALLLAHSRVPHFLSDYLFASHVKRRLGEWSLRPLMDSHTWHKLWKDTHYLLPLMFLPLLWGRRHPRVMIPFLCLLSYILILFPAGRIGLQYWMWVMPWIAWLIVENNWLLERLPSPKTLVRPILVFSMAAICLIQYLPLRVHKYVMPLEIDDIKTFVDSHHSRLLTLDLFEFCRYSDQGFGLASAYAWYADVRAQYVIKASDIPEAQADSLFLAINSSSHNFAQDLAAHHWCRWKEYPIEQHELWVSCATPH